MRAFVKLFSFSCSSSKEKKQFIILQNDRVLGGLKLKLLASPVAVGLFSRLHSVPRVMIHIEKKLKILSATAIAPRKYRFSSDHRSQARSRPVSTWMGDRLGTPGAVVF